ncbi:hypothetical protein EDI_329760 [Entamoeba dispar SAW760]|uniref:Uncharacterized protein n=1 Tax=Entamoeba dispar (strain ATCC PRA-260 / SAW760) TaxID=370354 RepID=B0EHB9_ENTDS|nr:uncharacterized protein EDI_329760 [Entamoeba dispar SAW760]EDR26077.1 hypothetical protein EDI_329760 [Entamoeba dispar SAW760]|eukprot:EDR26077.1 hypothetical protein EDI_329760 [Entamoeba dispar SAW760]
MVYDNSFNQLLSFGYLFDQPEISYKLFFHQLYNILNYGHEIIVCDRCIAQYNALKQIFPYSKLFLYNDDDENTCYDDKENNEEENDDDQLFEPNTSDIINSIDGTNTLQDNIKQLIEELN